MQYGYARVSTTGQATNGNSLEGQENLLREAGVNKIYKDVYTGKTLDRPQLSVLYDQLQDGDTLVVTKLDRIARSVREGISLIEDLTARGIRVNVLNMGILDNTPSGKLIRNIFLAFAEFERDMIITRIQEGRATAKACGREIV